MSQANFVIIEVSWYAIMVENDGVIWYHVGRSFSPRRENIKEGSTPWRVCCPHVVDMEKSF
jgi:hypothetical protein